MAKWWLLALLAVGGWQLGAAADRLATALAGFDGLRRALLVSPAAALDRYCTPHWPPPPPAVLTCVSDVLWFRGGRWTSVCADGPERQPPPPAMLKVLRRYELRLVCAWYWGGGGRLPLLVGTILR